MNKQNNPSYYGGVWFTCYSLTLNELVGLVVLVVAALALELVALVVVLAFSKLLLNFTPQNLLTKIMGLTSELLKEGLPVYSCQTYSSISLNVRRVVELNGGIWGIKGPAETLDDIVSYLKFYPEGANNVDWYHTELEAYQAGLASVERSIEEYKTKKAKLLKLIAAEKEKQNIQL